jgi:Protein of unknown function (DUF1257)
LKAAISDLGIKVKINDYVRGRENTRVLVDIVAVLEGDCDIGWRQSSDGQFDLIADLWGVAEKHNQTRIINAINRRYVFCLLQKEPENYNRLKTYLESVLRMGTIQEQQEVIIYTASSLSIIVVGFWRYYSQVEFTDIS